MKRHIWKGDLVELFDISRQSVMEVTDVSEEDKEFLMSQREDRTSSSMIGVDKCFASKVEKKMTKEKNQDSYKKNIKKIIQKQIR